MSLQMKSRQILVHGIRREKKEPVGGSIQCRVGLQIGGGNDQLASESDHKPDQGVSMQTGASSRVFVCWAVVKAAVVYSVSRVVGWWRAGSRRRVRAVADAGWRKKKRRGKEGIKKGEPKQRSSRGATTRGFAG